MRHADSIVNTEPVTAARLVLKKARSLLKKGSLTACDKV